MTAKLTVGAVYPTQTSPCQCIGIQSDGRYELRRLSDDWTMLVRDCRFDENGTLYWAGSDRGHWPKSEQRGKPHGYA